MSFLACLFAYCPTASLSLQELPSIAKQLLEGATIVVADEAHQLKNQKSRVNKAMQQINTRCRLALTGYPLQNNMEEYYNMIYWVRHHKAGMLSSLDS